MHHQTQHANQPEYVSFTRNALTLDGSVTPLVLKRVLCFFLYSLAISIIYSIGIDISIPIGPFEYAGLIMGLILVFRINNGYDRWWEGRKLWGNIVNSSRNFAVIIINNLGPQNSPRATHLCRLIAAMPHLIKNRLRHNNSLDKVTTLLTKDEITYLTKSENKSLMLATLIEGEIAKAKEKKEIDSFSFLKAEEQRIILVDSLGACERILNTPIPFVMAIKSHRFILFFLMILPLALVGISIYASPFISALVAYAIFSIDQIGLELQNPFSTKNLSHLPLDNICNTIQNDIQELIAHSTNEQNHTPPEG